MYFVAQTLQFLVLFLIGLGLDKAFPEFGLWFYGIGALTGFVSLVVDRMFKKPIGVGLLYTFGFGVGCWVVLKLFCS